MKTDRVRRVATGLLIGAASVHAWAQASEGKVRTLSQGSVTEASGGMTAKSAWKDNFALRRKVYAAIAQRKEINAGEISVVAKRGAVTLDGSVADAAQIDEVSGITKGVPGVTSVTSKLTVKKPFGSQ